MRTPKLYYYARLVLFSLVFIARPMCFGQGWVDFLNNSATLIYTNADGVSRGPTEPVAGDYYYGLFIAPPGTTDPNAFTFTGPYATNQAAPGRLLGGVVASVPGWLSNVTKSFLVLGWSWTLC